jgi:hypothetical protein
MSPDYIPYTNISIKKVQLNKNPSLDEDKEEKKTMSKEI